LKRLNSFIFIPANIEKYYKKIPEMNVDALIIDLEDSLPNKGYLDVFSIIKRNVDLLSEKPLFVRINNTNKVEIERDFDFLEQIKKETKLQIEGLFIPKFEKYDNIYNIFLKINSKIKILIIIETAKGLNNLKPSLEKYHSKIFGISIGAEDLNEDLDYERTKENLIFYRREISFASKLYNKFCFDTVYPFFKDDQGFLKEIDNIKSFGFNGKLLIHPRQVELFNSSFYLSENEVIEYKMIIKKYEALKQKGKGVLVYKDKIYERPHINTLRKKLKYFS